MSEQGRETEHTARAALIDDYASFWWAQETGETDDWSDLDADDREAAIEHSYAETVADWMAERAARPFVLDPPEYDRERNA